MISNRVIPVLLVKDNGLVKTVRFKNPQYIGDPINAVKVFNEKEVDELIFLDITATLLKRPPRFDLIKNIASETFMPFAYGGGLNNIEDIRRIFELGSEKVVINTMAIENPDFINKIASIFGSQSIVVSIDVKKTLSGKYFVMKKCGKERTKYEPHLFARMMEKNGAGELFINSIDNDGVMKGYDLTLLQSITAIVNIPVIACGGAGNLSHFSYALKTSGVSAVAAGSMFVYYGPNRAVLINYPSNNEIAGLLNSDKKDV